MENNIYQVNNKIFRDVFFSILAAIAGIYYAVAKAFGADAGLRIADWAVLLMLGVLSVFFINRAVKRNANIEESNYNAG